MIKIRFVIAFLLLNIVTTVFAQNTSVKCFQGDQKENTRDPYELRGDSLDFAGETSVDPNEIVGPQGYDSLRWVSINDVLNYTIFFENDPEFATANAQRVDVRFDFGQKELMKDFTLGTFGFANMSWSIENASNAYQTRIDLTDSMQIYVDLIAGLDVTKKQAFWKFSSVDPESGFAPWQHDRGMLPVNDSTHVGEGFVQFSLKPVATMKTGDTVSIAANIVFDQNDTIPTNRWKNVIDAGTPVSKVIAVADGEKPGLHHLSFEATDDMDGSGVKRVHLYLANQFGVFEEYVACPADSVINIETEPGRTYAFYSLAEDNVGNREPLKECADVVLNNNAAPTDILLSSTSFQDDIADGGFIAEISSVDNGEDGTFIYALAEGDGAIHNDLFQITGSQLQAKNSFKYAEEDEYQIRLCTTDQGGLSFSKAFTLTLNQVLAKPEPVTIEASICQGDYYDFYGTVCTESGAYTYNKPNDFMRDSVFNLQLTVLPIPDAPTVTVEGSHTLVSSVDEGNQWFRQNGTPIDGATEQKYTPEADGVYYVCVTNGTCQSLPSNMFSVRTSSDMSLELSLIEGWNWISSNLSDEEYSTVTGFVSPIMEKVERLSGQVSEAINDSEQGFVGDLTDMHPTDGYMIKMNQNVNNIWNGHAFNTSDVKMSMKQGWNWIGYVPMDICAVSDVLKGVDCSEGDVLKSYDDFAVYSGGEWKGTLTELSPGTGYMYLAAKDFDFHYQFNDAYEVVPYTVFSLNSTGGENNLPWHVEKGKYPYNMTIIGEVVSDGTVAVAGLFTIGAFVNDECRGIGRYVNGKLYMTLYGEISAPTSVSFKAFDNVMQKVYDINETVSFANIMVGSEESPFVMTIDGTTEIINEESAEYVIYPNPVRDVLYINGDVSAIKSITVLSGSGLPVLRANGYFDGISVAHIPDGSYIVVISTDEGRFIRRMLKVDIQYCR